MDLTSFTDLQAYSLPTEAFLGGLRTEMDFIKIEPITDNPKLVMHCLDKRDEQKEVVLKYIEQTGNSPRISTATLREITILKSLNHINVVTFHEVIIVPESINMLCLVMDYYPYSVARFIDEYPIGNIPPNEIKFLAKQLFSGLRYIHKNYIMHRDIKPDNLMLTKDGILKIIDFGLSRRFTYRSKAMTPDVVTQFYQPPEILLGAPNYDIKVDMWSAGCVLGELFARKPILPGRGQIEQIKLMTDLIGSPNSNDWPGFADCKVPEKISLRNQPYNRLRERLHDCNCSDAIDLLKGLLKYNPKNRLSAEECLEDDWFEKAPFPAERLQLPREVLERPLPEQIGYR